MTWPSAQRSSCTRVQFPEGVHARRGSRGPGHALTRRDSTFDAQRLAVRVSLWSRGPRSVERRHRAARIPGARSIGDERLALSSGRVVLLIANPPQASSLDATSVDRGDRAGRLYRVHEPVLSTKPSRRIPLGEPSPFEFLGPLAWRPSKAHPAPPRPSWFWPDSGWSR